MLSVMSPFYSALLPHLNPRGNVLQTHPQARLLLRDSMSCQVTEDNKETLLWPLCQCKNPSCVEAFSWGPEMTFISLFPVLSGYIIFIIILYGPGRQGVTCFYLITYWCHKQARLSTTYSGKSRFYLVTVDNRGKV